MDGLSKAIDACGGMAALAKAVDVKSAQVVWNWKSRGSVPAEMVIAICEAVAWEVTPHMLRPDLYPNADDALPASMRAAA